jgi:hypothetical protein
MAKYFRLFIKSLKEVHVGPLRVKIGPMKWAKLKFRQIIFCMEDGTYMMFYGDGFVSEIPSPKHLEIQEFAKNYHITAMKIKNFFFYTSTASLHQDIIIIESL